MDENERGRTFRPPKWNQRQEPNFTMKGRQPQPNQSGPSDQSKPAMHNQQLDLFLSGIRVERERKKSSSANADAVGKIHVPTSVLQGSSQPGLSGPSHLRQPPFPVVNANRPPFWQNPPPAIVQKSLREKGLSHQSENSQSYNVTSTDGQNSLQEAEAFSPVPRPNRQRNTRVSGNGSFPQMFVGSQFPPDDSFDPSQHLQQYHEPHPSGPHPPGSRQSVPRSNEPHPNKPHQSGQHPPAPHPFGQYPSEPHPFRQYPSEPHPMEPHPSEPYKSVRHQRGPHPFGQPGRLSAPPQAQSFHPQQQHRVQNRPHAPFSRPSPLGPPFPPMPPAPAPEQQLQQEGVTASPFPGSNLNHPATPRHQPLQRHRFPEPHPLQHPQAPRHEKSQREKDEEWLADWLRKHKIGQSEKAREAEQKSITLEEGRQLVRDLLLALRQLKEQRDMLDRHVNKDESSWQYECRRANRTKERVETLKARLFSKDVAEELENKIKKAAKKRARLKRHRLEKHEMEQDVEARRKEIHLRIDAELAKRLHAEQEKKREAELQEEVDKTLYEVRKKKQEVSQALELLKALRKLRQLRKEAAEAKGVFTPRDSDVNFDEKLKPLEELMRKQSVLYKEEERVMQVMLEEEHEEYKEQEKKRQKKRLEEKAIKDMQAKMKLLFGKDDLVSPDDPVYPFQQFYMQAESNVHALVDIRHQWDQFLVPEEDPEGSAVPVSWVVPSEPSSEAWAAVLES